MAKRDNHYERAFEEFLRARHMPYVAVDEGRRSLSPERSLKNVDFIVSPQHLGHSWLVDIKGRRFPSGRRKQYWKNWSTADDIRSLADWETLFGRQFSALLVFTYWVVGDRSPVPEEDLFIFRERRYGLVAIRLDHYLSWAHPISGRWSTVAMPSRRFRDLAQPLTQFLSSVPPAPQRVA